MNITDPIVRQCALRPDAVAIIENGDETTYGQLLQRMAATMGRLREAGVQRRQHVALDLEYSTAAIVVLLALWRLGAGVSFMRSTWSGHEKSAVMTRHEAAFVIHAAVPGWSVPDPSLPAFTGLLLGDVAAEADAAPASAPDLADAPHDASDDICLIDTTSGTTGLKKSVALTHAEFFVRLGLDQKLWLPLSERVFLSLSLETSIAKTTIARLLGTGRTLVFGSRQGRGSFFEVIEHDRPTRILTSTGMIPLLIEHARRNPAQALLREPTTAPITVTGSELPLAQLQWMLAQLGPNVEVQLGSTEASQTGFVDAQTILADPSIGSILLPWVAMEALDENGQVLPAGQEGVLRVRSPSMARGYYRDPQATAQSFRGGWFHPGDIGSVDAAGRVRLSGRASSLINMGGSKINPLLIERVLNGLPAVLESAVVTARRDDTARPVLTAVVVPRVQVDKQQLTQQIRQACAAELGAHCVPAAVAFAAALPRNAGGKVMTEELERLVAAMLGTQHA